MTTQPETYSDNRPIFTFAAEDDLLRFRKEFTLHTVDDSLPQLLKVVDKYSGKTLRFDLSELDRIDSAGISALEYLQEIAQANNIQTEIIGIPSHIQKVIDSFSLAKEDEDERAEPPDYWQRFSAQLERFSLEKVGEFLFLLADICYWSVADIFSSKTHRKGEFINQAVAIGVNAVPIIALIAFLIGLVLALQSAQQLRQFGANMFIADLVVISMTREMGPLLTAIMIAGRSGSAITSEIATMVVTEEIDALKTMALNPVRYIVIPKMHASLFTMPLLTILADICGILGGLLIAYVYLDLSPHIFLSRMENVLYFRDILTGVIKSLIFAVAIVVTGSYFGFTVRGGSVGVGRATTQAVVAAIFLVILADSVLGLLLY